MEQTRTESYANLRAEGINIREERVAVAKGAKLLDQLLPGWHKQVKLSKLDMENGSLCMMGQLFGRSVEGKLAREMYPEEMREANGWNGYNKALGVPAWAGGDLIHTLMEKLGLASKAKPEDQYEALDHACSGRHDNKCLWADEVAKRVAKEEAEVVSK